MTKPLYGLQLVFLFLLAKRKKEQRSSMRDTLQKQFGLELD